MALRTRLAKAAEFSFGARNFSEKGKFQNRTERSLKGLANGTSASVFGSVKIDKSGRVTPTKHRFDGIENAHKPKVKPMPFNPAYDPSSHPTSSADVEPPLSREAVVALAERLSTVRRDGTRASHSSSGDSLSLDSSSDGTSVSPFASGKLADRFNRGANRKIVLSDSTYNAVLDYHVEKKWFAPLWFTLRRNNLTAKGLQSKLRKWQLIQFLTTFAICGGMWCLYSTERDAFTNMPPEDRILYAKVICGMNAGEFFSLGLMVLKKEDPTEARPSHERASIVVKKMREMGLDKVDWDIQGRKLNVDWMEHGASTSTAMNQAFHLVFWLSIAFGALLETGGSQSMYEKQLKLAQ